MSFFKEYELRVWRVSIGYRPGAELFPFVYGYRLPCMCKRVYLGKAFIEWRCRVRCKGVL